MVEKSFTTNTTKSKTVNNDIWFPRHLSCHLWHCLWFIKKIGSKNPNYFSTCFGILILIFLNSGF